MLFSYEFHFLVMFLSKSKSIMTTKGMSLLARGSKGNCKLLVNDALLARGSKGNGNYWSKSE